MHFIIDKNIVVAHTNKSIDKITHAVAEAIFDAVMRVVTREDD